jgi:hypothetical protein
MFVGLLAAACSPAAEHLPDRDAAGTVGVLVDGTQRRLYLAPYDAAAPAVPLLEGDTDGALYALYFPPEYTLPTGEFVARTSLPWSRPLPAARQAERRDWGDETWTEVSPESVPPFDLPLESPVLCAGRGGCYADSLSRVCTVPCPTPPEPAPPATPEPPRYQPCPPGWTDEPALYACLAPSACASGQLYDHAALGCRAPGPAADGAALWPAGLDEPTTRFVRVGAMGGEGSRAAPWGSLAEALAGAPDGATLALSPGAHALPAALAGEHRVVGVSSAQTQLVSTTTVSLDGLTLASLTLDAPHLRARGVARLEGVHVRGSITTDTGELTLAEAVADGRVRVQAGAAVVVRSSVLASPRLALEIAGGGSAVVEASALGGGVRADGAVTVRDSALRSVGGPALVLSQTEAQLHGVNLSVELASPTVQILEGGRLTGQRLRFAGGQACIRTSPGSAVSLEDTVLVGDAVRTQGAAILGFDTRLTLRRVRVGGSFERVVDLDGLGSRFTLEDYVSTSTATGGIEVATQPPVEIRRARLTRSNSFKALAAPPDTSPWALDAHDVRVDGGLFSVRGLYPVHLERLASYGSRGAAVVAESSPFAPLLDLADVRIEGVFVPEGCDPRTVCTGVGIQALGGLRMERFVLRDNVGPALLVADAAAATRVHRGVVADQRTAVAIEGSRVGLWSLLEGVVLREVGFVCSRCGE